MRGRPWFQVFGFLAAALVAAASAVAGDSPLAEATRQFDAGNYQQAVTILRSALEQDQQAAGLHYWLGRCYFELRDFDRAVTTAEHAVQIEPNNSEYHDWLGRAYGRKAEQAGWFSGFSLAKKTRREFEEAVRLNPSSLQAQRDLIEFYLEAPGIVGGGDDKARRQIEVLAAIDAVEGHLGRADFWMDQKRPELAEAEYRLVMEAKLKRADPYFEVAKFYMSRSDAGRMEEAVEAAARVEASDRRLSFYRGVVWVLAGNRLEEAEPLLKLYLETVPQCSDLPSHAAAREWLGRLYERQRKCAAAAEQYRAALKIEPRRKSAQEALRHVCK